MFNKNSKSGKKKKKKDLHFKKDGSITSVAKKHPVSLTWQSRWNSRFLEVHVFSLKNMHAKFFNAVSCNTARKTLSTLPWI